MKYISRKSQKNTNFWGKNSKNQAFFGYLKNLNFLDKRHSDYRYLKNKNKKKQTAKTTEKSENKKSEKESRKKLIFKKMTAKIKHFEL